MIIGLLLIHRKVVREMRWTYHWSLLRHYSPSQRSLCRVAWLGFSGHLAAIFPTQNCTSSRKEQDLASPCRRVIRSSLWIKLLAALSHDSLGDGCTNCLVFVICLPASALKSPLTIQSTNAPTCQDYLHICAEV